MTPYSQTRIKQIVDCLTDCWDDIYKICRDWEDATLESLSEAQRAAADIAYSTCELNRNARQLYNLAQSLDLKIEVQRGEYSVETMDDCLGEMERIEGKIDGWFEQAQSSNDVPVNSYLANDIRHYIRSAIFNVKYLIKPLIDDYRKQKSIERIKQQLSYHPDCRTVIEPTKKVIEAELEKLFFSQVKARDLLERHLTDAQNQFEECLHWNFVAEATLDDIAEHILPFALVGGQLMLDEPVNQIIGDYSRAYAWSEFVNWLREQKREYGMASELNKSVDVILSIRPDDVKPRKINNPDTVSFESLFKKGSDIELCVNVLNSYEAGRRKNGEFIKTVVTAWIDCLHRYRKIHTTSFEVVVPILVNELNGLIIGKRTWDDHNTKAYNTAKAYFTMNIPH